MQLPVQLGSETLMFRTSIGIAVTHDGKTQPEQLMQQADIAMYRAKQAGRNTFRVYHEEMNDKNKQQFELENALPEAIKLNQLLLHYQPKVSVETNEVVGFEALIRWQHPEYGLIMPGEFIPLIDGSNLIIELDEWVLKTVIEQLAKWREMGLPQLPVAVNVSGQHLHSETLPGLVQALIQQHQLNPELLELEITEGVLAGNTDQSIAAMKAIKKTGVRLSIDDFGTGYSSLSYLKKFPVDVLKIDQAFIRECQLNHEDAAICKTIITLGKSLGLMIVAEGVETEDQLDFLKYNQCDIYQGYYFSRPIPVDKIPPLMEQRLPA